MAVYDVVNTSDLFQCVNILGVVAQQFLVVFQEFYKLVACGGCELSRINFLQEDKATSYLISVTSSTHYFTTVEILLSMVSGFLFIVLVVHNSH